MCKFYWFWGKWLKKVIIIFDGKLKSNRKCKSFDILSKKFQIFSLEPAFGSPIPGPASALYAPDANHHIIQTNNLENYM